MTRPKTPRSAAALLSLALIALAGCATPTAAPTATPPTAVPATVSAPPLTATPAARARGERTPIEKGPTLLAEGIDLRKVADVGGGNLRIAWNAPGNELLMLAANNEIQSVKLDGTKSRAVSASQMGIVQGGQVSGLRFGPGGALYVVYNSKPTSDTTRGVVLRGTPKTGGGYDWATAVRTVPYPASVTQFDHLFNGITFSPDGKHMFLNAGSRTDHGEVQDAKGAHPKLRETALTTKVLRVPANSENLELPNDETALRDKGFIFVEGTRNVYDMAFAPNGDLFGIDNGPDGDYPDEINWLREGLHYGFPWKFGDDDNPQQFADYDPAKDKRLSNDFAAVKSKTYANDPTFPKAPAKMQPPVTNRGPAATQFVDAEGRVRDAASEGKLFPGVTAHRSQLGLVFANGPEVPADLRSNATVFSAFTVSWGAAGGPLTDKGQDLLHLRLGKVGENYEMSAFQLARNFKNPIDSVLVANRLYVLEFGGNAAIWELTLK
jgi:glucose/arabinose dehydrogenase